MATTKLSLKTSYQLTINPVLHTFIGFLPLNRVEFINKIRSEVEANPMLELDAPPPSKSQPDQEVNVLAKRLERADSSFLNTYEERTFFKRSDDYIDKNRAIELFTAYDKTMADHLVEQAMSQFNDEELEVAKHIIYNLNREGYLDVEIESVASSINTTPEEIERIRLIILSFDPPGIAAKSLEECLLAQIKPSQENQKLQELIKHHLDELSRSKYTEIIKQLNISKEDLSALIQDLRRLNPKPGTLFDSEDVEYAEVDLMLIKEDNEYQVKFIDDGIPRLTLSRFYEQMLDRTPDKKTKTYLKQKNRNAQLFIEGIELRKSIIVKIADFLVKKQKDYLEYGEKWKKPLTMKEVAKELNYNESTISRAVNNKFIATPRGILSIKSFFSYGLKGDFGFKHSVHLVKDKIKQIIDEEPKNKPLSDQDISSQLSKLGIKISRRTIRNYREEMNIPNSSKRKEARQLDGI